MIDKYRLDLVVIIVATMRIYKQTISPFEEIPEWQARMVAEPRRKLEASRGKIMSCHSCRKPITSEYMVLAHIKGQLNIIVHEECADKTVEVNTLSFSNL